MPWRGWRRPACRGDSLGVGLGGDWGQGIWRVFGSDLFNVINECPVEARLGLYMRSKLKSGLPFVS